ncbi:mitochondrial dynamics protein MID51-like [Hydractinia symbiolongicarpus]|uniref:mitochondrial dynamics protein MID51-like n=1 Tax=Hydractinia symbiolongicarpus TaxID=13093 RepID=UPI00254EEA8D|nr:mitochondrial dynamics protein MID51-like [Hydractinia symbiolongicarpus]
MEVIPEEPEDDVTEVQITVPDIPPPKEPILSLKEQLQDFYDNKVQLGLHRKTSYEDIAYNVVHKIIRKVQTADSRFRANSLVSLGIPYDGLQAGQPIYFEMMLQLSLGSNNSLYLLKDKNPQFARVQPIDQVVWADCMGKNSLYISPKSVLRLLRHYVKRAVHVLRKHIDTNKREKLPVELQSLELEEGRYNVSVIINHDIHVKILPSITIPDCRRDLSRLDCPSTSHVVAVQVPYTDTLYDGNGNNDYQQNNNNNTSINSDESNSSDNSDSIHDDSKLVWKLSFFVAEKNKMRTVSDGCRIKILRILTEIRDNDPNLTLLSAYHLKTIFFHETDHLRRRRDWSESKIAKRFLGILKSTSESLYEGVCLSYFMQPPDFPRLNLFNGIDKHDLDKMKIAIDKIINDPQIIFGGI